MTRPTLIGLNTDKYTQGLRYYPFMVSYYPFMVSYYPFMVSLDKCNGSCNTLDDPSERTCVTNKTNDVNLSTFSMITRMNELKTLNCIYQANINVNLMEEAKVEWRIVLMWVHKSKIQNQKSKQQNFMCAKKVLSTYLLVI